MDTETILRTLEPDDWDEQEPGSAHALFLVIAWSASEPQRLGEVAILPPTGCRASLGRGAGEHSDAPKMRWFRRRPGHLEGRPPLEASRLSRQHLLVTHDADGVQFVRTGKTATRRNGIVAERGRLAHGDTLLIGQELLLLCVSAPALLPDVRHYPMKLAGSFGHADVAGIVGESSATWTLRDRIAFAAGTKKHVLVFGASGSGKELVARAIHGMLSDASSRPFVARNAATLPATLLDAELFGHARNYPNHGMPERLGLVGAADGGTLFLDEISHLSAEGQAHLLRVLDSEGEYQRLGDPSRRYARFRLVAATNEDPLSLKDDLLARFTLRIEVPKLEERLDDVPLLLRHLFQRALAGEPAVASRFANPSRGNALRASPDFIRQLIAQLPNGEIRGLENRLWQALARSRGSWLQLSTDEDRVQQTTEPAGETTEPAGETSPRPRALPDAETVRAALVAHGDNVRLAARALSLSSRHVLYRLLKKYDIALPTQGEPR